MHTLRYTPIPAAFYCANRDKLAAGLPQGALVIIHANDIYPTNADGSLAHHQNASLFYLTGIDQEETVLLMRVGENGSHEDTLLLRETNEKIVIWEGARLTREEATAMSGIADARWTSEYNALLAAWVPTASGIWVEQDTHLRRCTHVQTRNDRFAAALQASYPDAKVHNVYDKLAAMRLVKSPEEIAQIREACRITGEGFVALLPKIHPGMGEWEMEAELSAEYIRRRARKFSFHPIIASGKDTCVLHYITNHKCCQEGDLILFDIGAEYGGYAGDMTRTVPANGTFSPRQKAVYEAVLATHRYAASIMRAGVKRRDYERAVKLFTGERLVELGLATPEGLEEVRQKYAAAQAEERAAEAEGKKLPPRKPDAKPDAVTRYFMHGTSHSLGIDVHDVGSDDAVFAAGQVWTIEPGIYIPEESIGIRIETDVLITEEGTEDLIPNAPLEVADIEALMRPRS